MVVATHSSASSMNGPAGAKMISSRQRNWEQSNYTPGSQMIACVQNACMQRLIKTILPQDLCETDVCPATKCFAVGGQSHAAFWDPLPLRLAPRTRARSSCD